MKTITFLFLFLLTLPSVALAKGKAAGFVEVKNGRFEKSGKPYFFLGANFWQGMNYGASDQKLLKRELNLLQSIGVTQLRIVGLSEGPDSEPYRVVPAVQTTPTLQNEELLKGLDFLLVEIKKRDMTAVVCLSNFWPWSGGFAQWVSWSEGSSIPYPPPHPDGNWGTFQEYSSRFYTIPKAVEAQQKAVASLVSRVNSITKMPYSMDTTIMSWQLANEPRGGKYRKEFLAWATSTAKLIKSLDSNHMVSLGSEGGTLSPENAGNDFVEDHSIPEIDYATIHVWVENWGVYDPKDSSKTFPVALQTLRSYIEDHVAKAKIFKKPIVFEEFGMARDGRSMDPKSTTNNRDYYYQAAFLETLRFMKKNGAISGVNFWAWSGESKPSKPYGSIWKPGDKLLGDPPHEEQGWYGVYGQDQSTLAIIKSKAAKIKALPKKMGRGLFSSPDKILMITDSHGEGPFGLNLTKQIEAGKGNISVFAIGGTAPVDWLEGLQGKWGYWEHHTRGRDFRAMRRVTPKIDDLLEKINPDVVIIELGTNLIWNDFGDTQKAEIKALIAKITDSGKKCLWIGPPGNRVISPQQERTTDIYEFLSKEVTSLNCKLHPSWKTISYPEQGGDGIHYDRAGEAGQKMAIQWSSEVAIFIDQNI